jgi:hypothetical protein
MPEEGFGKGSDANMDPDALKRAEAEAAEVQAEEDQAARSEGDPPPPAEPAPDATPQDELD